MQAEKVGGDWSGSRLQWENHVVALNVLEKLLSEMAAPIRRIREGGEARDAATARLRIWGPAYSFARRLSHEEVAAPYTIKSERGVACTTCFGRSECVTQRGQRRYRDVSATGRGTSATPDFRFYSCQCSWIHRRQRNISSVHGGQRIQSHSTLRLRERCFDTSSIGRKPDALFQKYPGVPSIPPGHSIVAQRTCPQPPEAKT